MLNEFALLSRGDVHASHDAVMRYSPQDRQVTEILIQRHEHSIVPVRFAQDFLIAWIFGSITDPNHIVTCGDERCLRAAPHAGVEEYLQGVVSATISSASIRSCPTWRRANTRQAWMSAGSSHG